MTKNAQPLMISINEQNIYIAAGLGVLVLVLLGVISSIKTKRDTAQAVNPVTQGD